MADESIARLGFGAIGVLFVSFALLSIPLGLSSYRYALIHYPDYGPEKYLVWMAMCLWLFLPIGSFFLWMATR